MSIFISAAAIAITGATFWMMGLTAQLQNRKYIWLRVTAITCWVLAVFFTLVGLVLNGVFA